VTPRDHKLPRYQQAWCRSCYPYHTSLLNCLFCIPDVFCSWCLSSFWSHQHQSSGSLDLHHTCDCGRRPKHHTRYETILMGKWDAIPA